MNRQLTIRFLSGFVVAGVALGQVPLTPRPPIVKPTHTIVDATEHDTGRIYVKFHDDLPIRLRNGRLVALSRNPDVLNAATGLLNRLITAGATWERRHTVAEKKLDELREKAQRNTGKAMADLNTAYILRVPMGLKAAGIIDELNALDSVEIAQPMPLPAPDPTAGNYQSQQGYLNAAPGGVDATYAWTQLAGAGGNVWIGDIESNWNFNHTDLNSLTLIGPASTLTAQSNIDHGTAVLGILAGRNDSIGVTGIAYNSTLFVAARTTAAGYDPAAAITRVTAALREGDIIVLEMQTDGPAAGNTDMVPIEWESASYDAIRVAVGNGIIVVEAAGNGSQNLDAAIFNTGHSPFLAAHDSGAIIVGAGAVPGGSGTDRSRLDFSTFGSTVDLQGWGENVVTTGYGDLFAADGMNSFYTSIFNGTSSATPTVAGACAALQAHHKITTSGGLLTPLEVRGILRGTGSPQVDGVEVFSGTFSQAGTTVSRQSGMDRAFASSDINSIIRFSTGQQSSITALISANQVTVANSQTVATTTITINRPATQNIGPRPDLRRALAAVSGPSSWVDFAYGGTEVGTFAQPFNTLPEGVNNVPVGGSVIFKGGVNAWTGTITKQLSLKAFGSPVTLGQ